MCSGLLRVASVDYSDAAIISIMLPQYHLAVERFRQRVFSFAYYSLRTREDAEDITQEVFIKLWRNWKKIDHSKMSAWLMRVTRNAIGDHIRRQKSRGAGQINQHENVEDYSAGENVEAKNDAEVFRRHISQAIRGLKDPFRSIVMLRDIHGLSYSDIQKTLGMSESQVKVYLHRARRRLRENPRLREIFESLTED